MKLIRILLYSVGFIAIALLVAGLVSPQQKYIITKHVDAPVEHSFEVFMDSSSFPHWIKNYRGVKTISGAPDLPGHVAELIISEGGKELVLTQKLISYEKNKNYSFILSNDAFDITMDISFDPENGGTEIRSVSTVKGNNLLWKGILSLYRTIINLGMNKQYTRLAEYIESVPQETDKNRLQEPVNDK